MATIIEPTTPPVTACGLNSPLTIVTIATGISRKFTIKSESAKIIYNTAINGTTISETLAIRLMPPITTSIVRDEYGFRETDYHEAIVTTAKKAESIAAKYGKDSVAVAISDRFTNEEAYVMKK